MNQDTRVFALRQNDVKRLEERLHTDLPSHTAWRKAPHARFALKVDGIVLTCYSSGKLVVQGQGLDLFCDRFLSEFSLSTRSNKKSSHEDLPLTRATVGSDEAGKGDYFGPLVVGAIFCHADDLDRLRDIGVTDSKTLSDKRCRLIAGQLRLQFDHRLKILMPPQYNQVYNRSGNLNFILADLHAEAVSELAKAHPETKEILIDKFGPETLLSRRLDKITQQGPELVQVVRAERNPVVAAASILARIAFLGGLEKCSQACGSDLAKGAGSPVDHSAQRVYQIGGMDLMGQVAKLHFKNSDKIKRTR